MPLDRILEAQTKSEKAGENPSITFFTKLSYVLMHTVILDYFNIKTSPKGVSDQSPRLGFYST